MLVESKMQIKNCKLKNDKCGRDAAVKRRQFTLCNLQFAICNLRIRRRGLSLTEVLISMGILTVGLLGVASVFPVASFYMLKADNSDISSSLGQSAMNELVTRGMLDPWSWFVITPLTPSGVPAVGDPN